RGPFGELRLEPRDVASDDEPGEALDNQTRRELVAQVGSGHDSRLLSLDYEGAPALPSAASDRSTLVQGESHGPAFVVEEARIRGDDGRIGGDNLRHGAARRGASGRDETKFRHVEVDLEGVAGKRLSVFRADFEGPVRDARSHCRKPGRLTLR